MTTPDGPPPVVSILRGDREVLGRIAAEWRALCAEGPCNDPRLDPEWIEGHLRAFEPRARIAVFTVRVDGRLRGILPLVEHKVGFGPFVFRSYRSASGVHSARFELIHGAGDEDVVITALWRFFRQWKQWDMLHLRGVLTERRLATMVGRAEQDAYSVVTRGALNEFLVTIDPERQDFTSVIATRSRKFRQQLRLNLTKLEARGEVRLSVLSGETDPDVFRQGLETFYAIEAAGWKGRTGTAIACAPDTLTFYNAIADLGYRQKFFLLYMLEIDGTPVAASLNIVAGTQAVGLKTTYDETLSSCSPGHLMYALVLADSAKRGLTVFDMGGSPAGETSYKSSWMSETRTGFTGIILQNNLRGRAAHLVLTRLLPWLQIQREALPARLARVQQTLRHARAAGHPSAGSQP